LKTFVMWKKGAKGETIEEDGRKKESSDSWRVTFPETKGRRIGEIDMWCSGGKPIIG